MTYTSAFDADPAEPFDLDDLIEHDLRFFVTDPAVSVSELQAILTEVFTPLGRWRMLEPTEVTHPHSVDVARGNAMHRPSPPPTDAKLWEVSVALRGEGDYAKLGDQLVHAYHRRRQHFEYLASQRHRIGTGGYDDVLKRYPDLHRP